MDVTWIRCNHCFAKLITAKKHFSITQCGHVFCFKCVVMTKKQCPQCKSTNVNSLVINIPLQPDLARYFESVTNKLEEIRHIVSFQTSQMHIIVNRFNVVDEKYAMIKNEYWSIMAKAEKQKKLIKCLVVKEKAEKERLKQLTLSTPACPNCGNGTEMMSRMTLNSRNSRALSVSSQQSALGSSRRTSQCNLFTPVSQHSQDDAVFRAPTSTKVPRSIRQVSGQSSSSSDESQKKTPFSDYTPSNSE